MNLIPALILKAVTRRWCQLVQTRPPRLTSSEAGGQMRPCFRRDYKRGGTHDKLLHDQSKIFSLFRTFLHFLLPILIHACKNSSNYITSKSHSLSASEMPLIYHKHIQNLLQGTFATPTLFLKISKLKCSFLLSFHSAISCLT